PGNLPPTAQPATIAGPATGPGVGPQNQGGIRGFMPMAGPGGAGPVVAGAGPARPQGQQPEFDNAAAPANGANGLGPQIIADVNDNALLVVATESEYATIEAAIRRLDVLPMQVLIEATIAEVTLNDSLQYGTQFFLRNNDGQQVTLTNAQSTPTILGPGSTI